MNLSPLTCSKCRAPVPAEAFSLEAMTACRGCGAKIQVHVFPALFRPPPAGVAPELVLTGTEGSCYYHPQKKAFVPCDSCGRFLCRLCDMALGEKHLCPGCVESGRTQGKLVEIENRRILYGRTAFGVALLPILFWPATLVTGPMAIYIALRHWNTTGSLVRSGKPWAVLAIVLGSLQVLGWLALGYLVLFT